ncbi:hypothetical protein JCM8208_007374 [Rhodotorula glutinis]
MSNLDKHGSPGPATAIQSQHNSPVSRFGIPDLPWPSSRTARAPLFDPALDSPSPPSRTYPSPATTISSSDKISSSNRTSPATSFKSDGEQDFKREEQVGAVGSRKGKDKAQLPDLSVQGASTGAVPARSVSDDYFSSPHKRGSEVRVDFGLGIQVDHDGKHSVDDELARRTAYLDLRKTRSASPLEARRDSFTFFPSPSLLNGSPSPRRVHPFASSAALRSPQRPAFRREMTAPVVRLDSQVAERSMASSMWYDGRRELWTSATVPSTPLPHESPPLVPVPVRHPVPPRPSPAAPPPAPTFGLDRHLFDTPTRPAPLAPPPHRRAPPLPLPPLPPLAPLPTPALAHADPLDSARARAHTAYPLSPADTERVAQLHGGRVPSLQQLAPPQHEATAAAPVVNTGNVGPMVVQIGDWRCGVCAFINWRRRKICVKCFPHASDIGDILTIKSQQAASLARGSSSSTSLTSSPSSSSMSKTGPTSASPAVPHGYFSPAPPTSTAPASTSPPHFRHDSSAYGGASSIFAGSHVPSRPALAPVQPAQSRPPMRPPLVSTRSYPSAIPGGVMTAASSSQCDFRPRSTAPPPPPHSLPPCSIAPAALPLLPHNIWAPPSASKAVLSAPASTAPVTGGAAGASDLSARQAATERVRAMVQARAASAAGRR